MKTSLLMTIWMLLFLEISGIAFAIHDPTYDHSTPFGISESELPPCMSDREACQNPPICENTLWDCTDSSNIFSNVIESEYVGGGSIDLDQDLSPSYALDFVFGWKSIFVFVPMVSGVIATVLLAVHFILKKKKIRSRPYITIISAAIMLYFGIQTLSKLGTITMFLQQESPWHYLDQIMALLAYPIIGFSLTCLGIVFLYKSQLIRRLVQK
jgi:hypothetical protein